MIIFTWTERNYYRWIVTAAHCVYESVDVLASFGIDSAGNFSTKYVQIEWENVHFHPEHVPGLNSSHDIGWCYKHMSRKKCIVLQRL